MNTCMHAFLAKPCTFPAWNWTETLWSFLRATTTIATVYLNKLIRITNQSPQLCVLHAGQGSSGTEATLLAWETHNLSNFKQIMCILTPLSCWCTQHWIGFCQLLYELFWGSSPQSRNGHLFCLPEWPLPMGNWKSRKTGTETGTGTEKRKRSSNIVVPWYWSKRS